MDIKEARKMLGFSQEALAKELGWTGAKQVSNLETGSRVMQKQTELAIECLLTRAGKWQNFSKANKQ